MRFRQDSPNLDALRAAAVLAVFSHHLLWTLGIGHGAIRWLGELGVLAFFVHTSLVLMLSLERTSAAIPARTALVFYVRRLFRIYPLSVACVIVTTVAHIPAAPWVEWLPPTLPQTAANLLLVQNLSGHESIIGPLWSLPFEAQMYLVLPLLFEALRRRSVAAASVLWILSCVGYLAARVAAGDGVLVRAAQYAPCFMAGLLAWKIGGRTSARLPSWLWLPALILLGAVFLPALSWQGRGKVFPRWAFCLLLGLLIPLFGEIRHRGARRVHQAIAKYSYGIYLTHMATLWLAFRCLSIGPAARVAVFAAAAIAVPVAAYRLVEAPCIELGKRVALTLANADGSRFCKEERAPVS